MTYKHGVIKIVMTGIIVIGLFGGRLLFNKTSNELSFELSTDGLPNVIQVLLEVTKK